jgi:hypothetical protein
MNVPRAVLWLTALGFIGFGFAFALWPVPMARAIDIELPTSTALIDFTATYGGFELGFGLFLAACARRADWTTVGLWAGAAALAGFAVVRLVGMALASGPIDTVLYVAVILEVSGAAANIWALRRARS